MTWDTITPGTAAIALRDNTPDTIDAAQLLDDVHTFLGRFVAYPNPHARVAHTLWIAHTWAMHLWESTPRIAFLSPEPGSGKSRALEVTEPLTPRPVHAVNTTPSYLFRKVSDPAGTPTILYDEIDTVFGPRAKENEDIRGMLNAGHRRGATAGRCVVRGKIIETEELPAYCAVALAGLDDLPDTIASRSITVRMRRRAPGEVVEPWRHRVHSAQAEPLALRLEEWARIIDPDTITWPDMPAGVNDRDADVWEPLLIIADEAGGHWPDTARCSAVALVADAKAVPPTLGVQLLADIRTILADADQISTEQLLEQLTSLDEAPWADLRGKPLNPRGLSQRLSRYEIKPCNVRVADRVVKGYKRDDFFDAWARYLPLVAAPITHSSRREEEGKTARNGVETTTLPQPSDESATSATPLQGMFDDPGICIHGVTIGARCTHCGGHATEETA